MITDYDLNSWSQVGLIAGYAQTVYNWAEVVVSSASGGQAAERYDRFLPTRVSPNTKQAFYEKYVGNCPSPTNHACEESLVGSTRITDTNFNPFAVFHGGGYFPPRWEPQYFGEKTYQANDIMGTPDNHLNFTSMGVQQYSNDAFVLEPCTLSVNVTASRAAIKAYSCTHVDIWTTSPS
jgi:hypothetical protein